MITIAVQQLTEIFFVAIRLGTVLLLSPIEALRLLPIHARLILLFILSLFMIGQLPAIPSSFNEISLVMGGIAEFCNGLILSLSLYAAFTVFQIAGQLIDAQTGLNSLAILNPSDHSHEPLSGRLLVMLAVLFFLGLNGHHYIIQAILLSFMLIAPGQCALLNGFIPIVQQCSIMFSFALMLASPIILSLMIVDLSGAVLTRNMPQMSIYFLTLPIKIMLGLLIFLFLLNDIQPIFHQVFQVSFQTLMQVVE